MRSTAHRWMLVVLTAALLLPGGCPPIPDDGTTVPPASGEPADFNVAAQAPDMAESGTTVTLAASVPADVNTTAVFFEWFQTYGRVVTLQDPASASPTFVAPSFAKDETLGFRVDVKDASGRISSSTLEVLVMADPDFSFGGPTVDPNTTTIDPTDDPKPVVRIVTSRGVVTVELDRTRAPISVANFLQYVDDGFYDGLIFHRVIRDFVVQGGGYTDELEEVETRPAIQSEADNGLDNDRGTIAMARTNDPDSATSQFYFNLVDNDSLNARAGFDGYTVFGRITDGLEVIDEIAVEETETRNGFSDVPIVNMRIFTVERVEPAGE